MDETKKPSRRDLIAKGVAAVGAAVAATAVGADAATMKRRLSDERDLKLRRGLRPRGRGRLKLNNIPRARMTPEQLRKDNKARQASRLLRELGSNVEIQWVKGPKLPGGRRIIQING